MLRAGARDTRAATDEHRSAARRWIGLEETSRLLGVSATTLRRWSDAGLIETFITPGGHRRFDADSVRSLLPGSHSTLTMEGLGESPERISRAYRKAGGHALQPWVGALTERQRTAFREHGRDVARELLATLDAPTRSDRERHLAAASATAAEYGIAAAARRIPASATVRTFLQFRRPFLAELQAVSRRRGLDTATATDLLSRANDAVDELLVATMRAYEQELAAPAGLARGRRQVARRLELPLVPGSGGPDAPGPATSEPR